MTTELFSIKFLGISLLAAASITTMTHSAWADSIEPPPSSGAPSGTVGGSSRMVGKPYGFSKNLEKAVELNLSLSSDVDPCLQSLMEPWFP